MSLFLVIFPYSQDNATGEARYLLGPIFTWQQVSFSLTVLPWDSPLKEKSKKKINQ